MPFCLLRDPAVFYHCSDAWTGIQQDRELEGKKRELIIALLHLILSLLSTQASHPPPLPLDLLAKPPQADEDRILDTALTARTLRKPSIDAIPATPPSPSPPPP